MLYCPGKGQELLCALGVNLECHASGGAWQVVLLFMDELPTRKLPWDLCHEVWEENEEMFSIPLYILTSGILKAWPTEYDPGLVTLCKVITNMVTTLYE